MRPRRVLRMLALVALSCAPSCAAAGSSRPDGQPVTIRLSTGFPTGNFRPFSEALVKGYARADARRPHRVRRHAAGRCGNIEALEDGTVDIGLAQAGIAYMAYNGRLRDSARPLRGHSRHRHTELLGRASARRSRLAESARWTSCGAVAWASARRQRRRSHVASWCWTGIFQPGDVHEVDAALPGTNDDAAGSRARCRLHDFERAERRRQAPDRGGCAAAADPRTGVDRLRTMYPFFRSEIIPAGSYRRVDQPVHTLSVDVVLLTRARSR